MPLSDSEAFNIKFVQLVETYKCLYDITLPEYSSRDEQDRAWNHIAHVFTCTVGECKLRWKHLRGGLTRYIKKLKGKSGQAAKSMKQFYLWDVMQFVIPFLKSRDDSGSLPSFCLKNEHEEPDEVEADFDDNEADNFYETSNDVVAPESPSQLETEPSTSSRRGRKRILPITADDSFERAAFDYITDRCVEKPENPDLDFFKSILPDMVQFNASQKRRFKIRVLQLLEDISNEGTTSRNAGAFPT